MALSPCENLKNFCTSRPPLVIFMLCLGAFAVVLLTLAYVVKVREQLNNPDFTEDWNKFLESFSGVEFCVLGNLSETEYKSSVAQGDESQSYGPGKLKDQIDNLHNKVPLPHMESPTTDVPQEIVNVSLRLWVELKPTADFLHIPHNVTHLTTTVKGNTLGFTGAAADLEMNATFTLPFEWNSTQCRLGQCETVRIQTCSNFQAPASFFPTTRKPNMCTERNESGVEYHTKMVGHQRSAYPETEVYCSKMPRLSVDYKTDPRLAVLLTLHDRSVINLHLMHTSYFLFVMVITLFCYAIIRGRPGTVRTKMPPPQYTEVANQA